MAYDRDELVCPPQPKPPQDEYSKWQEQYAAEELKRQEQAAQQKAAYDQRTREYNISTSAATGNDPYEGEE